MTPSLPLPFGLTLLSVEQENNTLTLHLRSESPSATCPLCGSCSERAHSRYCRTLADLPVSGQHVHLLVDVRRFFCINPQCCRKLFVERLPDLTQPWRRKTNRLVEALQQIGLAVNGAGGARLAQTLGMTAAPSTMLRHLMQVSLPATAPVEVVGLDDFSFRRGRTFGTIVVNLTTHQIIDLLPDRSATTVAQWLRQHPEIQVVSRDRSQEYAQAIRDGAPQARQVADRFHIVHNLVEAIDPVVARCLKEIRRAQRTPAKVSSSHASCEPKRLARLPHNQVRFEAVVDLHQQHHSYRQIAEELGMTERTVRRWIAKGLCPDGQRRRKRWSPLNPHEQYLQQRWQQGCRDMKLLQQELQQRGFTGGQRTLYRYVSTLRHQAGRKQPATDFRVRRCIGLLVQAQNTLTPPQREMVQDLCRLSATLSTLYEVVQAFGAIVRKREGEHLDLWVHVVQQSGIPEVIRFAHGLEQDAAVRAGLTESTSNGMVEGFVNKVKLVKRQMYGQAGFALLRRRLLATAA